MSVRLLVVAALALTAGACVDRREPVATAAPIPAPAAAAPVLAGPLLLTDGSCSGPIPSGAAAIEPGLNECELVRLKGAPPTDVLIGDSGRGQREVQVLYAEATGRELYFFVDGRLSRIVR